MENLPPATIRKANAGDIDGIMKIERLSFHSEVVESKKVFEDRIAVFPDGFLIAEIETKGGKIIAGYVSSELWPYSEAIPYSNFSLNHSIYETHSNDGDELYISSFAVDPSVRGGKIGKHLFTALIDCVSKKYKLKSAILMVSSDWQNAYKMYQKEGFAAVSKISGFFPASENSGSEDDLSSAGIIMKKCLINNY
ncbi:MAG: GNAT family N-acetyltransferase [Methanosarcinales archaeon]|jgi:ribosomal-protein-alanine N-acetyltransferase|nr:GNAT family N-acetyltransferase [Methanosarcinales archaeon]